MDISRITSGYPMAYKAKSAINHKSGTENQETAGGEKSVFRWLYSADGSTGEVYKAQDYTLEHPVYRIKSRDAAGNLTEQMVDVSQVNPKNCNTYEMYAYAGGDLKGYWEWKQFLGFLSVKQTYDQPSFGTVMTEEELLKSIDAQLEKNKKLYGKTEADLIKENCPNWRTARFQFVGESKTYSYFEWIKEWEKRYPAHKK